MKTEKDIFKRTLDDYLEEISVNGPVKEKGMTDSQQTVQIEIKGDMITGFINNKPVNFNINDQNPTAQAIVNMLGGVDEIKKNYSNPNTSALDLQVGGGRPASKNPDGGSV